MNGQRKILLIDNASDRKERIKALSEHGYSVFPALKMEEARSRCTRGNYDLILVHSGDQLQQAQEFCDAIRTQCPKQLLLMFSNTSSDRDYAVSADLSSLLQGVDNLFRENGRPNLASAA